MIRTQIYLTDNEQQSLRLIAGQTGKKQSELIRQAIDSLIDEYDVATRREKLMAACGIWKDHCDLLDVRELRGSWDRLTPE